MWLSDGAGLHCARGISESRSGGLCVLDVRVRATRNVGSVSALTASLPVLLTRTKPLNAERPLRLPLPQSKSADGSHMRWGRPRRGRTGTGQRGHSAGHQDACRRDLESSRFGEGVGSGCREGCVIPGTDGGCWQPGPRTPCPALARR